MTTQIPDSWELPSYTAGDVIPFGRRQGPDPIPVKSDWYTADRGLGDIEPYDPEIHGRGPAEVYSQDSLDALERAGFSPLEKGLWHREVPGSETGAHHFISYSPGRRSPEGHRTPWNLTTNTDEVGTNFRTLRNAIRSADAEAGQIKNPKISFHLFAVDKTPAQLAAEKWLAENPEGFEEWHPEQSNDYTYSDFGDAAGMSHGLGGEAESWMMPGSAYHPDRDWEEEEEEQPIHGWRPTGFDPYNRHGEQDMFGDEESESEAEADRRRDRELLEDHGFQWRATDPTAGTHENPYSEDTPGEYYRYQHTPEGHHLGTHVIRQNSNNKWELEQHPPGFDGVGPSAPTSRSTHNWLSDAIDKYRLNSAKTILPGQGYHQEQNNPWFWTRDDPALHGGQHSYEHQIEFPEEGGFKGTTRHGDQTMTQQSHDLADIVREQNQIGTGNHPGGVHDHRWNVGEFRAHPSVALLGQPHTQSMRGGMVEGMDWHIPVEGGQTARAHAQYNWDTGDYDFRYRNQQGERLAPTHNYVPAGAPVTIPGRQR